MRIYLDTKDLINILEKGEPFSHEEMARVLRKGGHELVLSYVTIMEISAPLLHRGMKTDVMCLLNRIEKLPVIYIGGIYKSELREAYSAFRQGREYSTVMPLVTRFDHTLETQYPLTTHYYLNFGLTEAVFTLWTERPDLFRGFADFLKLAQAQISADRRLHPRPSLRDNFVKTIGLHAQTYHVTIAQDDIKSFAHWIYALGNRCPAIRLAYEAYHRLIRNTGDLLKDGDMGDFCHLTSIPYVDLMTLDRRTRTYAKQACKSAGLPYDSKILCTVKEIFDTLD